MKCVIVSSYPMFSQGLEKLLDEQTEIEIVGRERDVEQALETIEQLQPDIILLDMSSKPPAYAHSTIMQLLAATPDSKVIAFSLQNNLIHVYQASRWLASGVHDLLQAIGSSAPEEQALHVVNDNGA